MRWPSQRWRPRLRRTLPPLRFRLWQCLRETISFSQFSSLYISLPFLSVFEGVHHGHPTRHILPYVSRNSNGVFDYIFAGEISRFRKRETGRRTARRRIDAKTPAVCFAGAVPTHFESSG